MLARGNHKSAQEEPEIVEQLLAKDVAHGFSMVTPRELVPQIPGAMVQPVGLAKQWTMGENGDRKIKCRITQDSSYSKTSKEPPMSINSRIDMEQCPEMVHGWALPRIIHFIVAPRLKWPSNTIFMSKHDCSDACRRMAHSALAVAQTIATCLAHAFVHFRMTFGGSPNPPTWCDFSEISACAKTGTRPNSEVPPSQTHQSQRGWTPQSPMPRAGRWQHLCRQSRLGKSMCLSMTQSMLSPTRSTATCSSPCHAHHQETTRGRSRAHPETSHPLAHQASGQRIASRTADYPGLAPRHTAPPSVTTRRQAHRLEIVTGTNDQD